MGVKTLAGAPSPFAPTPVRAGLVCLWVAGLWGQHGPVDVARQAVPRLRKARLATPLLCLYLAESEEQVALVPRHGLYVPPPLLAPP